MQVRLCYLLLRSAFVKLFDLGAPLCSDMFSAFVYRFAGFDKSARRGEHLSSCEIFFDLNLSRIRKLLVPQQAVVLVWFAE